MYSSFLVIITISSFSILVKNYSYYGLTTVILFQMVCHLNVNFLLLWIHNLCLWAFLLQVGQGGHSLTLLQNWSWKVNEFAYSCPAKILQAYWSCPTNMKVNLVTNISCLISLFLQCDPNQSELFQMAVPLELCISNPVGKARMC